MSKTAQLIHDVEMEKKSKKKGFATLLVSGALAVRSVWAAYSPTSPQLTP